MKPSRYFEVTGAGLRIYEQPYRAQSLSVSVCGVSDLRFYRQNFRLRKVWGDVAP